MRISDDAEQRILDKAEYVEAAVSVLARKQELDEAAYRDDREHRAVVEREFQTSIEACIDIAGVLLSASTSRCRRRTRDDSADSANLIFSPRRRASICGTLPDFGTS